MSLGGQVLRGGATIYASFLTGKVLTLASTLILARLLVPEDFGLVGYALLVLAFFDALKTLDLTSALIYRQDDTDQVASEIFLLALVSAGAFYALCWVLAPLAAEFFHSSQIVTAIRLLGLTLVLDALGEVHIALLQKQLRFTLRYIPRLSLHVVKGVVSVLLALAGFGFWSLVWGQVAGSAVSLVVSWWVCPWRPRLTFRWTSARWSLKYGLTSTVVSLLSVAVLNADSVVVGRMLGDTALGLYDLAVTLPQMLIMYAAGAISQVAFPALSRLQQDRHSLRQGFLTVQRYSGLVLLPIGLGLCVVTPAFVHAVYTPVWWPMIPVMQALAIFATVNVISWTAADVFKATARIDLQWKLDLLHIVLLVPALVIGAMLGGILGVALAQIATVAPFRFFSFWLVHRLVGAGYVSIGAAFRVAVPGSLLMAGACLLASWIATPFLPPWAVLVVQVALGAVVYVGAVLGLDSELRAHAWPRWQARALAVTE